MTIITFPMTEFRPAHPHLRRFNVRTDLQAVANLVERCFDETLDADGRRYIQQMRSTAQHPQFLSWAAGVANRVSFPFGGFVWDQDGQIIGNVSLIPMPARRQKIHLIANVAVHPDHRRRGIARKLTLAALEESRARRADQVWLHVREDNSGARKLYRDMGFLERARRTSWYSSWKNTGSGVKADGVILPPKRSHWPQQRDWLRRLHPEQLDWYLSLKRDLLRPGLRGALSRLFSGTSPRQWAVLREGELQGVVSWMRTYSASDRLWLATPPEIDALAVQALLDHALNQVRSSKPLHLEFPAGQATGVLEAAGFDLHHTLIWMQYGG